jgi:transcription elongation factor GreA-like protein
MSLDLVPGALVRHPTRPDWGIGQVQSVIGNRVTVNFEHQGKHMINNDVVGLVVIDPDDLPSGG